MENKLKTKVTVEIDSDLLQTIRTIVHWTPDMSLRSFFEEALEIHLTKQKDHDKYREAVQRLRSGRPVKI